MAPLTLPFTCCDTKRGFVESHRNPRPEVDAGGNYHVEHPTMNAFDAEDTPDDELLARFCSNRDEAAFTLLVRRYGSLVRTTARHVVVDEHQAEDVHQAVFMVLCKDAHRIRNGKNLAGWLYGVTYRIATRVLKKQHKHRVMAQTESTTEADALTDLIARIERDKVLEELYQLPEKYRTILILKYYRQMTVQEVATALNLSVDSVAGRLKRGRNEMRIRLTRQGIGLLVFAAVVDSMTSEVVATESVKQTVESCLSATPTTTKQLTDPINQLALRESSSMSTRYLLKNGAIAMAATVAVTISVASWSSVRSAALAQERQSTFDELAATTIGSSNPNPADSAQFQIAATGAGNEKRVAGQVGDSSRQRNERRIVSALKASTDFDFSETPLVEVVDTIAKRHSIPVVIDSEGLAAESVTQDTPVSLRVNGIRLENAMKLVLRPHRLTAVVSEEVLLVTAEQFADKYTISTRIYPFENSTIERDQLAKLLQSKIAPQSWHEVGGPGSVDAISGALVVRNAARVHDDIADFLRVLEKIGK